MASQSEFVQDLSAHWQQHAFSWDNEVGSARILTWFLDHRAPQPRCTASREVRLYENFAEWEDLLLNAWPDFVTRDLQHEFHLVTTPFLEPNVLPHVIIVQASSESFVSNLVTVFDSFISSRPENFLRIAVATDTPIWAQTILTALGYEFSPMQVPFQLWSDDCGATAATMACKIWTLYHAANSSKSCAFSVCPRG